ncbi:surface lipoprotein assembly modifier [Sphingomonas glaciei]|uniref:Surface lipoprotein assembly modifier n=1 Tax=Sphingomonas glaciei TaxID=2938948 RepID=A0ABY5MXG1_9SPHN|nr:surface lipoprotein assembly modifier [Sphingomonas glaciei]UUR08460.1 surface lipoprotein assembly modifier [Sphingomonas glaciei]
MIVCVFACLAGTIDLVPGQPAIEQRVGGPQLLRLAQAAQGRGDTGFAERAYQLLLGDKQAHVRNEARFRLAHLHAGRGEWTNGARLLRAILDEQPESPRVRLELAGMLEKLGDEPAARLELRTAQASRPSPGLARLIDRYAAALRDRRPFGAEMRLAVAPDSNINRATADDRLATVLGDFGIDRSSRARSGLGLSMEVAAFGRLPLGEDMSLVAQAGMQSTRYKHDEFNRMGVAARVGVQMASGPDRLDVAIAHQRFHLGSRLLLDSTGLEIDWTKSLSPRLQGRLSASAALIDNHRNRLEDGRAYGLRGGLDLALSATTGASLSLGATRRTAADPAYSLRSADLGVEVWRDLGSVTAGLSATASVLRADDRLLLLPARRQDRGWALGASLTSRRLQWKGLSPLLRVTIERNHSNQAFTNNRRRALELGVIRSF